MAETIATEAPNTSASSSQGKADIDVARDVETYDFSPLYEQFNVEKSPRADKALEAIWKWAKETAVNKDRESVLYEVIKLKHRLGTGNFGDKSYIKAWNYVNTSMRMKEDMKRLDEMEKNNG